jgi:cystathionine beta-lyase
MKYDFDSIVNRKNTNSVKWDLTYRVFKEKDVLPMWVADMDFKAPEAVIQAINKRAEHGIFGYTFRPDSYYEAFINWVHKRHGWKIKKEWVTNTPGVIPALNIAIMSFTKPGDKIIVQSPVYYPFFSSVKNNKRHLIINPLKLEKGQYIMDYDDLINKIDSQVKMIILCNPHNPVGRVWTKDELIRLGEICLKNDIIIVSDEIHSDLIYKGNKHIPIASISEELEKNTVTCMAPSKTFNVAGLATSTVVIPDQRLRKIFNGTINNIGIRMGNIFGIEVLEAAYRYGEEWLKELLDYLEGNLQTLIDFISTNIPKIKVIKPEGTYLVWLDFREFNLDRENLDELLIKKGKIGLEPGHVFGEEGEGFQRINIACPRIILKDGLRRIEKAMKGI